MNFGKFGWQSVALPAVSLAITCAQVVVNDKRQKQLIDDAVEAKTDKIIEKVIEKYNKTKETIDVIE